MSESMVWKAKDNEDCRIEVMKSRTCAVLAVCGNAPHDDSEDEYEIRSGFVCVYTHTRVVVVCVIDWGKG